MKNLKQIPGTAMNCRSLVPGFYLFGGIPHQGHCPVHLGDIAQPQRWLYLHVHTMAGNSKARPADAAARADGVCGSNRMFTIFPVGL